MDRKGFVGFVSSRESLAQGFPSSGRGRVEKKQLALPAPARGPWGEGSAEGLLLPRWLQSRRVSWEVASSFSSKSMIQFSSSEAAGAGGLGLAMLTWRGGEWCVLGAKPSPTWTPVCAAPSRCTAPPGSPHSARGLGVLGWEGGLSLMV